MATECSGVGLLGLFLTRVFYVVSRARRCRESPGTRPARQTAGHTRTSSEQRRIHMRDAAKFGAETTASEVAEDLDLRGKVALVTGGSSGLGQETARVLAARGAQVILTARNMPKGEAVAEGIRA